MWDEERSTHYLKPAAPADNKYSRGVVTFITGSRKFPGAALLNTQAALACGVGMVRFLGSRPVKKLVILNTPQVVITKGKTDAFVLGSGVPESSAWLTKQKMKSALAQKIPTVLDAGALNLACRAHELTVLTPHYGELRKLLGANGFKVSVSEIEANPAKWAQVTAEKFNVTVLLKGNSTYVANSSRVIQLPPAPSQLATAGTGDVLAGILGALLAINKVIVNQEKLIEISATASQIHSNAAQLILSDYSKSALGLKEIFPAIQSSINSIKN